MGLTDIIEKDKDFEMYQGIIEIFKGSRAQDAIDTLNLFYQQMVHTIQQESQVKKISELNIEVL